MFTINFDNDFYYANNTVDSTFYIEINGKYFPDKEWTDFPLSVLDMWINVIISIYHQPDIEFTLDFMDGPWHIDCSKKGNTIHMQCIDNTNHKTVIEPYDINIHDLANEILLVSENFVHSIEKKDYKNLIFLPDLKKSIQELQITID